MGKTWSVPAFLLCVALQAQACRVLDPELQMSYAGPCKDGLAEGLGSAAGRAEYRGGFKGGRKHGQGVKSWPNGDRYEGGFVEDRKEGRGVYRFGRGPWAGERYEGGFLHDRRHGHGEYRWASGDVYRGPWKEDIAVGPPTAMMKARASYIREARTALRRPGQKVCRAVSVGIALRQWRSGVVVDFNDDRLAVRSEDGQVSWDELERWIPCW